MRILLVRPGAIGDALLVFPVIMALRARYDDLHVTLVSNGAILGVARELGVADEVYDYGSGLWSELFSDAGIRNLRLRDQLSRIERALCWLRDPTGIVEHNLRACGIQRVVIAPGRPAEDLTLHVTSYLAGTIGLTLDPDAPFRAPKSLVPATSAQSACALHPGSGGTYKCWPVERFAQVMLALWARSVPVLLLAGPADHARLHDLLEHVGSPAHPSLLTVLIDAPLLEVARMLLSCRIYLGNDSGVTHLAALLGLPTVALFGPTQPSVWHPIGPHTTVLQAEVLANLHVDTVLSTIIRLL